MFFRRAVLRAKEGVTRIPRSNHRWSVVFGHAFAKPKTTVPVDDGYKCTEKSFLEPLEAFLPDRRLPNEGPAA